MPFAKRYRIELTTNKGDALEVPFIGTAGMAIDTAQAMLLGLSSYAEVEIFTQNGECFFTASKAALDVLYGVD